MGVMQGTVILLVRTWIAVTANFATARKGIMANLNEPDTKGIPGRGPGEFDHRPLGLDSGLENTQDSEVNNEPKMGVVVSDGCTTAHWRRSCGSNRNRGAHPQRNNGYGFTERWSAELAYGKELARYGPDTSYHWKWVDGDNSLGIGTSYTLWENARHSLDVSVGLGRNLTASETSISFELGYSFSFWTLGLRLREAEYEGVS
jgi:hypothetical protein